MIAGTERQDDSDAFDSRLVRDAQRGDERAFSLIVSKWQTPVFNYVLRMVGDRALAEDLTQEVFLRVFQALPGFSHRSKFTTWLFHVTRNRVVDELRCLDRRPRVIAVADGTELGVADPPFEQSEVLTALWRAVANLDFELKTVLLLREIAGLSYAEIAEALDLTLATIKWRIYKAREDIVAAVAAESLDRGLGRERVSGRSHDATRRARVRARG